ncbi:MAG: O-antigen ligase family protein [Bacteroidia bacterium]|nr:O-antigen ligase family protein [Bacteroidia bacterium]
MEMSLKRNGVLPWLYAIVFAFLAASLYGVANNNYYVLILPWVLTIISLALFRLDNLFWFTVFITPLSINLSKTALGIGVSLPAEPVMFGVMLVYLFKVAYDGGIDKKVLFHPISLAILFHLLWMAISSVFSEMRVVSIKHTAARFTFEMVFFYMASQIFKNHKNIYKYIWFYLIPLLMVVGYALVRHAYYGFTDKSADWVMSPFYNDHTAYAAALAFYLPVTIALLFGKFKATAKNRNYLIVSIILLVAIILSFTRAAYVGLTLSFCVAIMFLFRIKFSLVASIFSVLLVFGIIFQNELTMELEKNREESTSNVASQLQSITNITTDASNVERFNRWNCAFKMFKERPVFGWGPGTYAFLYAPFQVSSEKTIISTNFGDGGNAHSEILGPLAEQGLLGSISYLLIVILVSYYSSIFISKCRNRNTKLLAIGLLLGLISYWVHGFLNNFLDTDKASVTYWGFIAALVALQVYYKENNKEEFTA